MILTLSPCIIYITTLPMFSRNVNPSLISQPLHFSPPRSPHIRNISYNSAGIGRAFSFQIPRRLAENGFIQRLVVFT